MAKSTKGKKVIDPKATKNYMRYSGMAFQIVGYIIVGIFLGKQLDKYFETSKPIFTALLSVVFLIAYFVKLVADLSRK